MESPAIARSYAPSKSKKRAFMGGSSMDPDVIEIPPPPVNRSSKSKALKFKEVMDQEIIDVDMDENHCNIMLTEGIYGKSYKGKGAVTINSLVTGGAATAGSGDGVCSSRKSSAPGSQNVVDLDGFVCDFSFLDDDYVYASSDCTQVFDDNQMYDDEYEILQSHFDNIDIPPGVEAPVPWFLGPDQKKITIGTTNSSTLSNAKPQANPGVLVQGMEASHSLWSVDPWVKRSTTNSSVMETPVHAVSRPHEAGVKKFTTSSLMMETPVHAVSHPHKAGVKKFTTSSSMMETPVHAVSHPHKAVPPSLWSPENARSKNRKALSKYLQYKTHSSGGNFGNKSIFSGVASSHGPHNPPGSVKQDNGVGRIPGPYISSASEVSTDTGKWYKYDNMFPMASPDYPIHYNPFLSEHMTFEEVAYDPFVQDSLTIQKNATDFGIPLGSYSSTYLGVSSGSSSSQQNAAAKHVNGEEVLKKVHQFKKFDIVQDPSDHHYMRNSLKQPSKSWAKKIQEEWKILEKDLPDTIFVRAYESRMDLLRAVIMGAEGTPYHDGLFFFDVFFPDNYPYVPPDVYYYSRGLRLNPNLYNNGKVCLSLLNTWSGSKKEMWTPNLSTMLQVLVSIQGLILNAKPYFNEPGFASSSGTPLGEKSSLHYNESTFILSLKTMVFTLRKQPKHFEDFVVGHFFKRALDILVACKAYMDGAQVGCLVKGGVQDVDEGDKSCSENFKATLSAYFKTLVDAFTQIGVKDCEQFIPPPQKGNSQTGIRQAGHKHMSPALKSVNYF